MISSPLVPRHRLVASLSEALDCAYPDLANHELRVAYMAMQIAERLGLSEVEILDVFLAASLHDIGLVGVENRAAAMWPASLEEMAWHSEAGYELLRHNELFAIPALAIRYHHMVWADGRGAEGDGQAVPLASHILAVADSAERKVYRGAPILSQCDVILKSMSEGAGRLYHPDCVAAFKDAARTEAFWLDLASDRIYSVIMKQISWPMMTIDPPAIAGIAEIFARVVDASSRWTATHTAGVAATAVVLAERLGFSPREVQMMRAAGYLHDLGKLSVPCAILDKPGKLTPAEWTVVKGHPYYTFRVVETIGGLPQIAEWAAFHHERLNGQGYSFHHQGSELTLGSRIMAVADTFTAVAEDRPYRPRMNKDQSLSVLVNDATRGALDGDVVATLAGSYDEVDGARHAEQQRYGERQRVLAGVIGGQGVLQ
jgi:HD-GYP domain-containing protein (c-di-GMP phosphodiesterase class II)